MMDSQLIILLMFAMILPLAACEQTSARVRQAINLYDIGQFPQAAATLKPEISKKNENYVLNNCRYGSCALAAGDLDGAFQAFMTAYEVMNATHVNDAGRTAGATVLFEGFKVWTGEPFERAMAHYYLGLICLKKHDYDNARAAFQNGLFKLRDYAGKEDLDHYKAAESNFALGYFGLGYCYLRQGKADLAEANFKQAMEIDPRLKDVIEAVQCSGVNTLIFVEAGAGPRKVARGWYNEESAFRPTPAERGPLMPISVLVDGQAITSPYIQNHMLDTLAMAQEKRWQDIDTVKKVKAAAGTGMMAAGTGMAVYGANTRHNEAMMWAGVGTALAGAALAASSQSDVRNWEMLPRTVYMIPASLSPGQHQVTVQGAGMTMVAQVEIAPPNVDSPGDNILYFRGLDGVAQHRRPARGGVSVGVGAGVGARVR
ncbi:MAG: tetratricopeptide repeat protein [Phycisphaerales bacterium]|nr:tetratricopeptide repeat protein [Phycisphaerales bacterium]